MKALFIFISLIHSFNLFANNKVLFVDANNNPGEIKIAREVAKQQGKELVVYPSTKKEITVEDVAILIKENQFSSITFSGHSGGMLFYGENGEILLKTLIEQVKNHPNAKHIESLYLLGCNSGNKSKMMFWKDAFPNIKFVAGFDGTAPLGTNQAGLNFYKDIMSKEDKILQSANSGEIKKNLESVKNVTAFPTSILVECQPDMDFLYQPKTRLGSQFEQFSMGGDCEEIISFFRLKYKDSIDRFLSREKNPRVESAAHLKEIYEALRQKEHCEKEAKGQADANQFLFVRFMNEFDKNFMNYFNKPFAELISSLNKIKNEKQAYYDNYAKEKAEIETKHRRDEVFYQKLIAENKSNVKSFIASMANTPDTKKCHDSISHSLSKIGDTTLEDQVRTSCSSSNLAEQALMIKMKSLYGSIYKSDNAIGEAIGNVIEKDAFEASKLSPAIINHTIERLEMFMKSPEKFNKQALTDLANDIYPVASILGTQKAQILTDALYTYRNMDPYTIPYSWYDKPYGQSIEPLMDPLLSNPESEWVNKLDQSMIILRNHTGSFGRGSLIKNLLSR